MQIKSYGGSSFFGRLPPIQGKSMKELLKIELGQYTVVTELFGIEWQSSLYDGPVCRVAPVMRTYSTSIKEAYAEHLHLISVGKNLQRKRAFVYADR